MVEDFELPDLEFMEDIPVATLPRNFEKIWKILWSVDPARLRRVPEIREQVAGIALRREIAVARATATLATQEAEALEQLESILNFKR